MPDLAQAGALGTARGGGVRPPTLQTPVSLGLGRWWGRGLRCGVGTAKHVSCLPSGCDGSLSPPPLFLVVLTHPKGTLALEPWQPTEVTNEVLVVTVVSGSLLPRRPVSLVALRSGRVGTGHIREVWRSVRWGIRGVLGTRHSSKL